jgi:predicted NodU family carbamoyl transferase
VTGALRQSGGFMFMLGISGANPVVLPDAFVLPGGRVRLHVVERRSNPLFWRLLKRFVEHAAGPMLVNASFNLFGEPPLANPQAMPFQVTSVQDLMRS